MPDPEPHLAALVREYLPPGDWRLTTLAKGHNHVLGARGEGGDLVVRLHPLSRLSPAALSAQTALLEALARDRGIRAPRPVRLPGSQPWARVTYDGVDHSLRLVSWVSGEGVPTARAFGAAETLSRVGAAVGRLHDAAAGLPDAAGRGVGRLDAAYLLGPESVLGVIDFDELRVAPFALDLLGVLWTHALWPEIPSLWERLLAGYETQRRLPTGTRGREGLFSAILFALWFRFVFGELDEADRAPNLPHVAPMADRIEQWCGVC